MQIKSRYRVKDLDPSTYNGLLLPQVREYLDEYIGQFKETHGWTPDMNTIINEIIEFWALSRRREDTPIMPGYSPDLYQTMTPLTIGDKVKVEHRLGMFVKYLPANKALVDFDGMLWTIDLAEVVAG